MAELYQALALAPTSRSVKGANGSTLQQTLPREQATIENFSTTDINITCQSVPAALFTNGGARYQAFIRRGDVKQIKHISLIIDLTVTGNSVVLAPATHWFEQIELKLNVGGTPIKTWYNDMFIMNAIASKSSTLYPCLLGALNMDSNRQTELGQTNALPVGTRKNFIIPLESGIWERLKIDWSLAQADLTFDFKPERTGIIISGVGSVVCNGMTFLVEDEEVTASKANFLSVAAKTLSQSSFFIDPIVVGYPNQTLSVGSNSLDLNNLNGKAAAILLMIRPSVTGATNANNGFFKCVNIGDESGARIDIQSVNKSILGGTGLLSKHARTEKWAHSFMNNIAQDKPFYLIQHGQHLSHSFQTGKINGYHQYTGTQTNVLLTCVAAVNEVQTITCLNADNTKGSYRFMFRGEHSASLTFASDAAAMAAAVNAMKVMKSRNITVVFTGGVAMEGTLTATFTTPETNGLSGDLLEVIPNSLQNGAAALDLPVTTITTPGTDGIVAGASYDIKIYALTWKAAAWSSGLITSEQM